MIVYLFNVFFFVFTYYLKVVKEGPEDIMPEEVGVTPRPTVMTVQVEEEEVDIFLVVGVGVVRIVVAMMVELEERLQML